MTASLPFRLEHEQVRHCGMPLLIFETVELLAIIESTRPQIVTKR
jgi:hypothetical protein